MRRRSTLFLHKPLCYNYKIMKKGIVFGIIIIIISALGVLSFAAYTYIDSHYFSAAFSPAAFEESTEEINNPYRGMLRLYGYMITDNTYENTYMISEETYEKDSRPYRLILAEINLKEYASGDISDMVLKLIDDIISSWEDTDKALILRFLYDWDGKAMETEPKDINIILRHMEQVAPIVNAHKDRVFCLQGIFVGNTGEMNNSDYMENEKMIALMKKLASCIDPEIFLSVRTPQHYRIITDRMEPVSREEAFTGELPARIGLFNDGMLGSGNDLGTYGDDDLTHSSDVNDKGVRDQEIEFQNELCRYVPNGGEVILYEDSVSDFLNAVHDLPLMHVTYLNSLYDGNVLAKWADTPVEEETDPLYAGMSGLDYIERHLGYRYVVTGMDIKRPEPFGDSLQYTLNIKNTGYANAYRRFNINIHLSSENGMEISLPVEADNRLFDSGDTSVVSAAIPKSMLPDGTYDMYLTMKDPDTGEDIIFANDPFSTSVPLGGFTIESGFRVFYRDFAR